MPIKSIAILNGTIVTPKELIKNGAILIENHKIKQVSSVQKIKVPNDAVRINAKNRLVVPGFIDLHLQGSFGYDVWDKNGTSLSMLCQKLATTGTTSFLATTEYHPATLTRLSRFLDNQQSTISNPQSADVLGIHLEGPFINPEKKGGIPQESIQKPGKAVLTKIYQLAGSHLKMMTIAPELKNTHPLIQDLVNRGIIASLGHTAASFVEATRGFDIGISHATHLFNQMPPIHHRTPGAILACLLDDWITVQVICDGIHLDWEIIKLIYRLKGPNRIALITDAVRAAGLSDGVYHSQGHGRKIIVKNGKVTRPDGTIAGSTLTMNRAVANAVNQVGVPLLDAIQMATLTPAKILGLENHIGSIALNKDADIVILDNQFTVLKTFSKGILAYSAS